MVVSDIFEGNISFIPHYKQKSRNEKLSIFEIDIQNTKNMQNLSAARPHCICATWISLPWSSSFCDTL